MNLFVSIMARLSEFEFFSSLRYFLPEEFKNGTLEYPFNGSPSVKDAIEALGAPHTEVAFIICNGRPVDFTFQLKGGENIAVYPYHHRRGKTEKPISPLMPPKRPSFIADVHLGRLARFMRVAGFDTLYEKEDPGDETIAAVASKESRIVLTRDVGLLKRSVVHYGYILRSSSSRLQFSEVVERYSLKPIFRPFGRCVHCNGLIGKIKKKEIESSLPEGIRRDFDKFFICSECSHVYWEGSHYKRISDMLKHV
ncbi:MAG: Mut7-C ubiquitin/RNAse domain-containing protein [Deltaproteobacteria bacterium]|nr:Mut7-C ubiquitin/RNAse domain-containing protein [Deltaproteobacteria bacterium]